MYEKCHYTIKINAMYTIYKYINTATNLSNKQAMVKTDETNIAT